MQRAPGDASIVRCAASQTRDPWFGIQPWAPDQQRTAIARRRRA